MESLPLFERVLSVLLVLAMVYTGLVWHITKSHTVRMDSSIIANTLIFWGILYGVSIVFTIDRSVLSTISRLGFIMICLSQSVPLTVSYLRSKGRGDK